MKCKRSAGGIVDGAAIAKKRRSLFLLDSASLLILLCFTSRVSLCRSFTSPRVGVQRQLSVPLSSSATPLTEENSASSSPIASSLPDLYPSFSNILASNGYVTPTPIQQSSTLPAKEGDNLLLIAATGSGKTLAYLLPALSRACEGERRTVLIVAPTRELSAQLQRDASLLLPDETDEDGNVVPSVVLAVRGIPPPTPTQLAQATVLIGTPTELHAVLTRISGAQKFLAGGTLSGLILDEVDVLLPPAPKGLRTTFDGKNDAQQDRKKLEQRRKLRAAQRRGVEFQGGANIKGKSINSMDLSNSMNSQVLTPTERVLRLISSGRYVGDEEDELPLQILAGSATASRTTLDRLNKALRSAGMEGGVVGGKGLKGVWQGRINVCRPEAGGDGASGDSTAKEEDQVHTIRAVTVPSVVDHRYVNMSKAAVTNSHEVLTNVGKVMQKLKPKSSLLFICGEFSRSLLKEKKREGPKVTGNTSQARRNAKRRQVSIKNQKSKDQNGNTAGGTEPLSVRKACSVLQSMGVDAQPMHVVLGLETGKGDEMPEENENQDDNEVELPPVLVTFEGSARGLHFDGVDMVFVVGRPTSAASYLHLAGRVGRAMSADITSEGTEEVEIRPGTVVSFCSKGRVTELEKWKNQVGATELEEIEL